MSSFKEIVTKAVVGNGRKSFENEYSLDVNSSLSTILGCWVINHSFSGKKEGESINVSGSFDVNIWYSRDNNTETEVVKDKINYNELIPIRTLEDYNGEDDIIVRMIKQPTCVDALFKDGKIIYKIDKTIAVEVVGDTKIRVGIEDSNDLSDFVDEEVDKEVNADFLK